MYERAVKLAPFCVDLWAKYIEYLIDASKRFQDVKEYSAGYAGIHSYLPNTCVCSYACICTPLPSSVLLL